MRKISIVAIAMLVFIGIVISYGQNEKRTIHPIYIIPDSSMDISQYEQRTIHPIYITSESDFNSEVKMIQPIYSGTTIKVSIDATEQIAFPSYVSLVLSEYKVDNGIHYGYGNGVLIDKENKLFIANAHVIREADSIRVGVNRQWYLAQTREEWINWEADLAIIQVDIDSNFLPEPVCLEEDIPARGTPFTLAGHMIETDFFGQRRVAQYVLKGVIIDSHAEWGIFSKDKFEVASLLYVQERGYFIFKEDLNYLYESYIGFSLDENQDFPSDPRGLSGSLTDTGCLSGIVTGLANNMEGGLSSPVNEIRLLWEKAKKDIEAEKTNN
ncbi:S1C family serine protease [Patescibacteria group bacterium AH-259-L05]|nr:S1C family serine protease [Patescibacteria group bacterium AH-259-L05]